MNQVIQDIRVGKTSVMQIPPPMVQPGHLLIANQRSLVSAGTEKMVMDLAKKSLLGKARERPDQVRRVIEKIRNEGFFNTLRQVQAKLDEPMSMGYSSTGVVLACGDGVQEYKPGDLVASNGPHAEVVCVPKHLCARVPDNVTSDQAAFTVLGAIAMQGVRLSKLTIGETVLVIGLGLVGQLTVALLKAAGCRVIGTDLDAARCDLALKMGADVARANLTAHDTTQIFGELGADAILITAATKSDGPIQLASQAVRQKGRIVLVGVADLHFDRRPMFFKEAEFVVSCSYGPGRYDADYEQRGHDYPAAHVRWTEQRNLQAVLDLMAKSGLDVTPLISHRFAIQQAEEAYRLIEDGSEPFMAILLEYPGVTEDADQNSEPDKTHHTAEDQKSSRNTNKVSLRAENGQAKSNDTTIDVGVLGAGNFAKTMLIPKIVAHSQVNPITICSAKGVNATQVGRKNGFRWATTDERDVLEDQKIDAVFSITRHDHHARQVIQAIQAGKHIFVEKPLCLTLEEMAEIEAAVQSEPNSQSQANSQPVVMVGFNRRFSPAAKLVNEFFNNDRVARTVSIRFNAGDIPRDHWTQNDSEGGGRIIGEACHAIDLATFLTGSEPVKVFAESIGGPDAPSVTDDQCFITIRHANGSISNIGYLAGGDKAYAKERIEVIGGGKLAVIEDFRRVTLCSSGKQKTHRFKLDKGHGDEIAAFVQCIRTNGEPPISWSEIASTTRCSILAVRSLREGVPIDCTGSHTL